MSGDLATITFSSEGIGDIQALLSEEKLPYTLKGFIHVDDSQYHLTASIQVLQVPSGELTLAGFATINYMVGQTFSQAQLERWYLQIVSALMLNELPLPKRICSTVLGGEGPVVNYQIPKLIL
jgi:hypothetical protein